MKFTQDDKLMIDNLRNLCGGKINTSEVNDFLKSLLYLTLLNFSENESTKIPYFGELKIEYKGDKTTVNGRVADLKIDFIPSDKLVKNIGQLIDVQNPNCNFKITDVDCIKDLMNDISDKLNHIMEKE